MAVVVGGKCIGCLMCSMGIFLASKSLGIMYKGFCRRNMSIEEDCWFCSMLLSQILRKIVPDDYMIDLFVLVRYRHSTKVCLLYFTP